MEKQSSVKDIYQHIKQDLREVHKKLCEELGDNNPFAKFSIGSGSYVWVDNRCEWFPMIDTDEQKQSVIREEVSQLKAKMSQRLGNKTTEALFTIPDDSFIFYNDEDEKIKILITGWGFKKPVRIMFGGETVAKEKKNPVNISFVCEGERLKYYAFGLHLPKQLKRLVTDENGVFTFPNLAPGESYVLTDLKEEKDYNLDVVEGQSQYDFEVIRKPETVVEEVLEEQEEKPELKDIKVIFRDKNNQPIVCDNVLFQQYGQPDMVAILDENGVTVFKEDVFLKNTPLTVTINGWNNPEKYEPITFTLNNEEYEYLIQEEAQAEKESTSYLWLEILAVIAALAALLLLWPYFETFCSDMFDKIY